MTEGQRDWLVAADDRTGALEVGAQLATAGALVTVTVGDAPDGNGVVDLGCRAMTPDRAAALVRRLPRARWNAHKIDSTLRGHWPDELRARAERTLLIPAWPALGRTCVAGVVHVHGSPVAAVRDGMPEAVLLEGLDALDGWLAAGDGVAAVDVTDTAALHRVAAAAASHDVVVAGPAGAIGAAFAARFGAGRPAPPPRLLAPIVVVCASASPVSREQITRLRDARPDIAVLAAPPADGALDVAVAAALAAQVRVHDWGTVVVVGGDTAAAVLGAAPRLVGGEAAPGMPWSRDGHGGGPVVVTKAGGFGGPDALVTLLSRETA